ncbi:MAG: hypothetical protein RMN53_09970, partial [Anaerolineae bacterium]|nr:hypothetical protein [Anaerolineae bacterium]
MTIRLRLFVAAPALLLGLVYLLSWRPEISSVPVVPADGELTVLGRGFGSRQGTSTVVMTSGSGTVVLKAVTLWSDTRIVAALPPEASSGTVRVIRRGILGER